MNNLRDKYQALLIVSFGGPEGPDDVMPFLRNVLSGKNVPEIRMLEVAEHYQRFGGVSPINAQNRDLIAALEQEFRSSEIELPIYFGNRNWHPFLADTLLQMKADGIRDALAFFTSTTSCYSGCRQYRENIFEAQQQIGSGAPRIHKLRMPFNHPSFIEAAAERLQVAMDELNPQHSSGIYVLFTAHSIPKTMADGCQYERQLQESSRLVAEYSNIKNWSLVYQSRSGPPMQPWLEPDVRDYLDELNAQRINQIVIMPIGFVSDHMEVMFDLDVEAREKCAELGINMVRASTVGTHPKFVSMIRELILERAYDLQRRAIGKLPASHDVCPPDCCQLSVAIPATRPV